VLISWGCAHAVSFREERGDLVGDLRARVAAAVELKDSGAPLLSGRVEPMYADDLDVEALVRPSVRRALPTVRPGARARLEARTALQVGVASRRLPVPLARGLFGSHGLGEMKGSGACRTGRASADAYLVLHSRRDGVQARLTPSGTVLRTRLRGLVDHGQAALDRAVTILEPVWVGTSLPDSALTVSVPVGRYEICLATPTGGSGPRP
jgi:hypothetical protein